jgi:hypothetical protein
MVRMMMAQPQLPTREWIRLSSQKMGFGEDGEPAVVDGELQAGGDLFEGVLELSGRRTTGVEACGSRRAATVGGASTCR